MGNFPILGYSAKRKQDKLKNDINQLSPIDYHSKYTISFKKLINHTLLLREPAPEALNYKIFTFINTPDWAIPMIKVSIYFELSANPPNMDTVYPSYFCLSNWEKKQGDIYYLHLYFTGNYTDLGPISLDGKAEVTVKITFLNELIYP
jgi:hypothetical protein